MNFVAFGIIADIDNLFYNTFKDQVHCIVLEPEILDKEGDTCPSWTPVILNDHISSKDKKTWNKVMYSVYWFSRLMY